MNDSACLGRLAGRKLQLLWPLPSAPKIRALKIDCSVVFGPATSSSSSANQAIAKIAGTAQLLRPTLCLRKVKRTCELRRVRSGEVIAVVMNPPNKHAAGANGHEHVTILNATVARTTKPQFVPWSSSGSALSYAYMENPDS